MKAINTYDALTDLITPLEARILAALLYNPGPSYTVQAPLAQTVHNIQNDQGRPTYSRSMLTKSPTTKGKK